MLTNLITDGQAADRMPLMANRWQMHKNLFSHTTNYDLIKPWNERTLIKINNNFMPSPAISCQRHYVFGLYVCVCIIKSDGNRSRKFHQICNLGAFGDKDELIRFWDQKVKG